MAPASRFLILVLETRTVRPRPALTIIHEKREFWKGWVGSISYSRKNVPGKSGREQKISGSIQIDPLVQNFEVISSIMNFVELAASIFEGPVQYHHQLPIKAMKKHPVPAILLHQRP
jgi:hypothetical protein